MARPEEPAARGQREGKGEKEKKERETGTEREGSLQGASRENQRPEGRPLPATPKEKNPTETRTARARQRQGKGGHEARPQARPHTGPNKSTARHNRQMTGQSARPKQAKEKTRRKNARATYLLSALLALSLRRSISVYLFIKSRCFVKSSV